MNALFAMLLQNTTKSSVISIYIRLIIIVLKMNIKPSWIRNRRLHIYLSHMFTINVKEKRRVP